MLLDGSDLTRAPMYRRARTGIGYLAQEPSIFRKMTVEENILAILETRELGRDERHRRLDRVSPLAVPALIEIGRETVDGGSANDALLAEAEAELVAEAMGGEMQAEMPL